MEFWGVEVKSGQPLKVNLGEGKVLHLSQACLGEIKNTKSSDSVCLYVNVDSKKLVLGTLNSERLPQQLFDLVFDKDFQISHNWKNGSVFFYGYKADQPIDGPSDDEDIDSDEEEDALELPVPNGKQDAKKEENTVAANKKDNKQKVKIVEPEKDDSDSDEDDSMSGDSDEDDEDSDSEDDSDEGEETPQKPQSGKKRPNESAIKTPANEKKAKLVTPQKTDGKKGGVHVATPHPSKQGKTPANKSNESPASASGGAFSCKPCNRNFKTDMALQSHNQAKHK
ncbi:putative histone deacetylase transcription factor C2H2 family [Helianthus debilis subsp. tardiflorus]